MILSLAAWSLLARAHAPRVESYVKEDPLPVVAGADWSHRPVSEAERACSLHLEVRCDGSEAWRHWLPGVPVCASPADFWMENEVWFLLLPPHEDYYFCGENGLGCCFGLPWRRYTHPDQVGPGVGQWQLVDGAGVPVTHFVGVWAVDLHELVAILGLEEHYTQASADPACVPRDGHSCWTTYETWTQLVDWQKEHCSPYEPAHEWGM